MCGKYCCQYHLPPRAAPPLSPPSSALPHLPHTLYPPAKTTSLLSLLPQWVKCGHSSSLRLWAKGTGPVLTLGPSVFYGLTLQHVYNTGASYISLLPASGLGPKWFSVQLSRAWEAPNRGIALQEQTWLQAQPTARSWSPAERAQAWLLWGV